jgi:hypothetical protein
MKPNRSRILTISTVVLALFIGFLMCSCATTGDGKTAEPDAEAPGQTGNQSTAADQSSGSSQAVKMEPVAYAGGSEQKQRAREAGLTDEEGGFQQYAASVKQALERVLSGKLTELDWNRIATVAVGLLFMAMIYALAFALGRLPARRRAVAGRGGRKTLEQAEGPVSP